MPEGLSFSILASTAPVACGFHSRRSSMLSRSRQRGSGRPTSHVETIGLRTSPSCSSSSSRRGATPPGSPSRRGASPSRSGCRRAVPGARPGREVPGTFDAVLRDEGVRVSEPGPGTSGERLRGAVRADRRRECPTRSWSTVLAISSGCSGHTSRTTSTRGRSGPAACRAGRPPTSPGSGDDPNPGRTKGRARRADPRVPPGGVIRIVEPFRPLSAAHLRAFGEAIATPERANDRRDAGRGRF